MNNALLIASQSGVLVVYVLAAVIYHVLAPWWRYEMGRMIMAVIGGIVSFAASGLATLIWGEYPGRVAVLLGLRLGLIVVGGWLICQLVVAQAYGELRRRGPERGSGNHVQ